MNERSVKDRGKLGPGRARIVIMWQVGRDGSYGRDGATVG